MGQGTLKVNTEKLLPIIKKWLYSDKDIFIRELVSNACDAINKLRILKDHGEASYETDSLKIDLVIDKISKTLKIIDTGIGMTKEEVEKYIAQVAFSGAEEFLSKYQSQNEKDQVIGHFGLGFYSAYMVAGKVEINTLSYQPQAEPALWSCDGGASYQLESGNRLERGTEITLFIDEENQEYLEESKIREILNKYCAFLPYPIYLNGTHVNAKEPLWMKNPSDCSEKDYLEFYRALYPMESDPIFWIHLNVDYPFHLKGILYFPKLQKRYEFKENHIKLFCNRVFVSDNCRDLLPEYLAILKGALDSPDIPLNVSRSYLQMDKTVRQLGAHISKKITDRLSQLFKSDKEKFLSAWEEIEMIVKLGTLQDEKFYERAKEFLIWKTLSEEWITIEEYLNRRTDTNQDKIFYTVDDKMDPAFLSLYKNKGIEVLHANAYIDVALINFLEPKHSPVKFQRIDGGIDASILDPSREKSLLDAQGKTEAVKIADFVRATLEQDALQVEAKSLASDQLPAFIMMDEQMRRFRDYMAISGQNLPSSLNSKRTFVVNTNSKLIHAIYGLKDKNPSLAKEILTQVYELSLLSQKELTPQQLSVFVQRSTQITEKLLEISS